MVRTHKNKKAPQTVRIWKIRYGKSPEAEITIVADDLDSAREKSEVILRSVSLIDAEDKADYLAVLMAGEVYL